METPQKSANQRIAAGAGLVTIARTIGGIANLLLILILTRLLDKPEFAIIAAIYMLHDLLCAVGSLGLPSALSFFVPKTEPRAARALGMTTGAVLFTVAIPIAALLYFGGPWVSTLIDKPDFGTPLMLLALAVLADFPGQVLPHYFIAREQYVPAFWVTLGFNLIRFLSLVVPAAMGYGPLVILTCFAAASGLRLLWFLLHFLALEKGPVWRSQDAQWSIKDLFQYGLPLAGSVAVGKINIQLDKYMVLVLLSPAAFAVFSVGAIELPLVTSVAYSITTALLPTLVKAYDQGDVSRFVQFWHGSMTKSAALMMPVFVFFMVMAEPAMRCLFSAAYVDAVIPFRVYLCLLPLRLCGYGAVARSVGKTKPVLVAAACGLLTNLILNYPLYLALGLAGPALASILAQMTAITILLFSINRSLQLGLGKIFPYKAVLKTLCVALIAGLPLYFFVSIDIADWLRLVLGTVTFLACYLPLALRVGVIGKADLQYLKSMITGKIMRGAR